MKILHEKVILVFLGQIWALLAWAESLGATWGSISSLEALSFINFIPITLLFFVGCFLNVGYIAILKLKLRYKLLLLILPANYILFILLNIII